MILQLLSTMLLLAGPAIGAGAGQRLSIQSQSNATSFCAPASPKGAYYNSSEEYGTTLGYAYNYSSYNLQVENQSGPNIPTLEPNQNAQWNWKYYDSSSSQSLPAIKVLMSSGDFPELDFYINGVLTEPDNISSPSYIFNVTQSEVYVWVFDHQEAIPLSPEPIFDVVGDATTASAGILGNGFNAMIALFYANNQLTGLGIICLILTGVGLVWFAWRLVLALFRRRA